MGVTRYSAEFKYEAVGQVLERGYSVKEVANNLGISVHSLYIWIKKDLRNKDSNKSTTQDQELSTENARLKAELKRVTEERDILKKAAVYFANQSD
jgi:transposase